MFKMIKSLGVAVVLALTPAIASAATISGDISIAGAVNMGGSDFTATGNVDLVSPGLVIVSTGDFAPAAPGSPVTLTDVDFTAPGTIWDVAGFTFVASSYAGIFNDGTDAGFTALGIVSGTGFDDTNGVLVFTTQDSSTTVSFSATTVVPLPAAGLMLIGALGALAIVRRRKVAA